ncbi:lipase secretion chaperone [Marinomonas sp. PE14-40]|uniref:lipase secretion chaperone n=1 Tax=Marinomonas sp. PE14-40 TaxID=3060621 RepID=UPI003F666D6C
MNISLTKKVCLIAFGGLAFLGLAKWTGVAYQAAPVLQTNQDQGSLTNNQISNKPVESFVLSSSEKADIKAQLNVAQNNEYNRFKDKFEWIGSQSSLRGTSIAGSYPIDAEGHLFPHISIKHRFDYFMTLLGELSYEQLIELIKEDIKLSLEEPARREALELLGNYQAFKYALKALDDEFSNYQVNLKDKDAIINRQINLYQEIDMLRYEYFEPDYRLAFFEQDIADEQALIATLQGNDVANLAEDKTKLTGLINTLEQKSEATGEDLFDLQAKEFGVEAAQRLANVRESQNELNTRVRQFIIQKESILNSGLSHEDQSLELKYLIESKFSLSEQKRLTALVAILQ